MICDCGNGLPARIQCVSCGRSHEIDDGLAAHALSAAEQAELIRLRADCAALRAQLASSEEQRHQQAKEDRERVEGLLAQRDDLQRRNTELVEARRAVEAERDEAREHAAACRVDADGVAQQYFQAQAELSAARAEIARLTGAVDVYRESAEEAYHMLLYAHPGCGAHDSGKAKARDPRCPHCWACMGDDARMSLRPSLAALAGEGEGTKP